MSVLAILQARVGSTRMPQKMLAEIAGLPILVHSIRRAKEANLVNRTILAIPDTAENDCLAAIAASEGCEVYRGSELDLVSRYYWASQVYPDADVIVRLTADDPFKDPALIDLAIELFLTEWGNPRPTVAPPQLMHLGGITWPLGLDVEVMTRAALTYAYQNAPDYEREHATQFMARESGVWILKDPKSRSDISTRFTVDTIEDYSMALRIAERLKPKDYSYDATLAAYNEVIQAVAA